ncbi:MAG: iron-sulfur cluster assembly scaffold protein [Candidatus Micrarchaeia archaeon]
MEDLYQEFIIELYKHPLNFRKIPDPDYHAEIQNTTCGDMVELFIKEKDGIVAEASFIGKGCAISQASASLFTGFLKGKRMDSVTRDQALALLKINLEKNPSRMRCALLPFEAMKKAIRSRSVP